MFLNRLDQVSKKSFLQLAHHIGRSDDTFSNMQKTLIQGYCSEMGIDDIAFEESEFSLENTLKNITEKEAQKIVLMEVLALVYSDNIMHPSEKEVVDTMVDLWEINSSLVTVYGEWSKSLLSISITGEALLEVD